MQKHSTVIINVSKEFEHNITESDSSSNGEIRGTRCFDRPLLAIPAHRVEPFRVTPAQQMPKSISIHQRTAQHKSSGSQHNQIKRKQLLVYLFADSSRLCWWDSSLFFFHRICSISFLPSYFSPKRCAHASTAKALGLIPIPKCFTASVITSSWVSQFKSYCSLPLAFHLQVIFKDGCSFEDVDFISIRAQTQQIKRRNVLCI